MFRLAEDRSCLAKEGNLVVGRLYTKSLANGCRTSEVLFSYSEEITNL